jgi:uncharacterized protein YdeI (BOF family)
MRTHSSPKRTLIGAGVAAVMLTAAPAMGENPYQQPDETWISLSGTVVAPSADAFTLDYGEGVITVEMDDWDSYGDAYGLMDGDNVTVYGRVDDDLYELSTIEAAAVYVQNLNTYFYASSADEEGLDYTPVYHWNLYAKPIASQVTVSGTVTSVSEPERRFTLDTGKRKLTVETEAMAYNPLDDLGYQQLDTGDVVSVTGDIDYEFFDGRVLEADSVTTILDDNA